MDSPHSEDSVDESSASDQYYSEEESSYTQISYSSRMKTDKGLMSLNDKKYDTHTRLYKYTNFNPLAYSQTKNTCLLAFFSLIVWDSVNTCF